MKMIDQIIAILSDFIELSPELITTESRLVEDLNLNSLDIVNIVIAFEEEFDIDVPDEDMLSMHTVGDIEKLLTENVNSAKKIY